MKVFSNLIKSGVLLSAFFILQSGLFAQNIAINSTGNAPDASAMMDVQSSGKGILIPRISLTAINAASPLTNPAHSLLVYNTNASLKGGVGYYYNSGTNVSPDWAKLVTADSTGIVKSRTPDGEIIKLERFPMGEVSMNNNSTKTIISSANGWFKVEGATTFNNQSYQFSNGGVDNRLQYTGTSEKMFHIACTISVKAVANGSNLKAVLYKNGVALSTGMVQTKMFGNTDIISTAIHVMTNMQNGDYLELWITNTLGSDDFTVTEMNLFAMGVSMGMD